MTQAAIIGAGDLGGAIAQALAGRDRIAQILIVDAAANVAAGKALDIMQSGPIDGFHTRLEGTDDLTRIIGTDVCVIADRFGGAGEWQGEEGLALIGRLLRYCGTGPMVFAGSTHAALMLACARELRVPGTRMIGSAAEGLAAAMRAMVAAEAQSSPRDVSLAVLGAAPAFVIPWSAATIAGHLAESVVDQVQLHRLQARLPSMWPPGPTTLGTAAARIAEAVVESSRSWYSVMTLLTGEYGAPNTVATVPAQLGPRGILRTRTPALTPRERALLGPKT